MGQTFEQFMRSHLEENGLHPQHIEAVMPVIINDDLLSNMRSRWTDQVEGYPRVMANTILALARPVVFKWISENIPAAWFRPIFAPGADDCMTERERHAFIDKFWKDNPVPMSEKK